MFDRTDDPDYLQARLEAFITRWHGWRRSWFGEARAESLLAKYQMPAGEEVWFRDGYLECRCTLFSGPMIE
jgi:hypothetical protein